VESALELATRQPFDLHVSDIGLPDRSGHELMCDLQRHSAIRGVAISGFGMEGDRETSTAAGFSEHLLKPVSFEDFEAAISRIIAQS
jgi:CheY-like chemotaxis protein